MARNIQDTSITSRPNRPGDAPPDDNLVAPRVPRAFMVFLLAVVGFATGVVCVPFWAPLFLGMTLAATVYPVYQFFGKRMPQRPKTAALLTLFAIMGVIIVPLLAVFGYAATQLDEGMSWVRHLLAVDSWQEGLNRLPPFLHQAIERGLSLFSLQIEDLRAYAEQGADKLREWGPQLFGVSMGALGTLLMTLVSCGIFLVEAVRIKDLMLEILPLKRDDAEKMLRHLRNVSTASFLGLGCTAISHSFVVGLAFWLVGVPHVTFFAILTLFAAFIPMVGSMLLYGPVALVLGLVEGPLPGIGVFVGCFVGALVLDNLLKPVAQKGRIPLHGAMAFFSAIGGLTLFGLMGTILGPMAMVAATSLLGIYRRDYLGREELIKS
jgi:predicted PurR-regulated permease PerM